MHRSAPIIPPDLITYRRGSKYVYVAPAATYEEALDVAKKEFPEELGHVLSERIAFTVSIKTSRGDHRTVRISESAWAPAVARLLRGDVIDIEVRRGSGEGPPPQYLDVPSSNPNPSSKLSPPQSRSPSRSPSPTPSRKGGNSRLRFWEKDS